MPGTGNVLSFMHASGHAVLEDRSRAKRYSIAVVSVLAQSKHVPHRWLLKCDVVCKKEQEIHFFKFDSVVTLCL